MKQKSLDQLILKPVFKKNRGNLPDSEVTVPLEKEEYKLLNNLERRELLFQSGRILAIWAIVIVPLFFFLHVSLKVPPYSYKYWATLVLAGVASVPSFLKLFKDMGKKLNSHHKKRIITTSVKEKTVSLRNPDIHFLSFTRLVINNEKFTASDYIFKEFEQGADTQEPE